MLHAEQRRRSPLAVIPSVVEESRDASLKGNAADRDRKYSQGFPVLSLLLLILILLLIPDGFFAMQ